VTAQRKGAEPTAQLRWVEQLVGGWKGNKYTKITTVRVLQQLWRVPQDPSPTDLRAIREEWRDIETVSAAE
jgi:hypothetical protein